MSTPDVKEVVREKYGQAALRVKSGVKKSVELWVGCIAGALSDYEYVQKLAKAGFEQIDIEPTRVYDINDARAFLSGRGINVDEFAKQLEGKFISAFVRASKPVLEGS
jgi:arsenite methyltransferase